MVQQQGRQRKRSLKSIFTGTAGKMFFMRIGLVFLSIVPFFGLPNAVCIWERYKCKNTQIVGMPLEFVGKPANFLKMCFVWGFFSVITIGIYALVVLPVRVHQWKIANTVFGPIV